MSTDVSSHIPLVGEGAAVLKHKNLMENEYFFFKNHFSTFYFQRKRFQRKCRKKTIKIFSLTIYKIMSRAFPQSTRGRSCIERCTIQNQERFGDVCSCKTAPYKGQAHDPLGGYDWYGKTWDWDKCPDNECDDEQVGRYSTEEYQKQLERFNAWQATNKKNFAHFSDEIAAPAPAPSPAPDSGRPLHPTLADAGYGVARP